VECILREAEKYELGKAAPKDFLVGGQIQELVEAGDHPGAAGLVLENTGIVYRVQGPNSNTFVGIVGKRCGLTIPRSILPGLPGGRGKYRVPIGLSFSEAELNKYLLKRFEWLQQ